MTFYRRTLDPVGVGRDVSWPVLAQTLQTWRDVAGDKARRLEACPLWSPVELTAPRRASSNVAAVSCLVLDYDDGVTPEEALDRWEGYERVVYTTWSHTVEAPRCRLVLPLARPVPGAWWKGLYRSQLTDAAAEADPQCIDPARAYYLPAIGAGGPHWATRVEGEWLDVYDRAQELYRQAQEAARALAERHRQRAADLRARQTAGGDRDATAARILAIDPDARRALAVAMGATLASRAAGEIARAMLCRACGRPSVWWAISKGWARCDHVNTCGWSGPLYDYART